jgi:hypothetical protein
MKLFFYVSGMNWLDRNSILFKAMALWSESELKDAVVMVCKYLFKIFIPVYKMYFVDCIFWMHF